MWGLGGEGAESGSWLRLKTRKMIAGRGTAGLSIFQTFSSSLREDPRPSTQLVPLLSPDMLRKANSQGLMTDGKT